ncbi:MAG TPA: thiamine pyrophosphate-binding protein [Alphaproteobacteria bacterium]|nr:thiamine pyrophosphate-binding protein [Alphaproteobacteria bacterium]
MNQLSGAEAFVRMLQLHDVKHIFGLCGDTSLPLYDALYRLDHGMTHILTRDERSAAYMADGYARVSGKVGICEGPSGGGATYILPGVVEANESSIPILAVTTDVSVSSRGRFTLTELDQESLFRPLSKWNRVIDRAADIPKVVRAAFTHMTTGKPGAAHIGLPFDVQKDPVDEADVWADKRLGRYPARRIGPDPHAIAAAAELLAAASNPVIICGGGVVIAGAERELQALAEALAAPVATTISGQGSISDAHPLAVGVVGSNGGTVQTRGIVERADLVMFVGCRAGSVTTERWRYPAPGKAKIVHVDVDASVIGVNYKADAAIVGDAKLCLEALAQTLVLFRPDLTRRKLGPAEIAAAKKQKFDAFRALAASNDTPIKPERVIAELQSVLPKDAVIVADPGTPCPYFSAYYELMETGRHFISNRAHGALGYSMAASVGAHYGRPSAKVVAVMGDGSFGFTAGEMETIVRLKVPVTMIVISNSVYGWIKAGQKSGFKERYFSVDFSRTDHARVAEAFGVKAWTVKDPADLRKTLRQAVEHGGPTLVDIIAQPLHDAKAPVSEWVA